MSSCGKACRAAQPYVFAAAALALVFAVTSGLKFAPDVAGSSCAPFTALHATRHARRHRRHVLLPLIEAIPTERDQLAGEEAMRVRISWSGRLAEAHCLLQKTRDPQLRKAFTRAIQVVGPAMSLAANRTGSGGSQLHGRRLGRWAAALASAKKADAASSAATADEPASTTRRVTRGLGVFAGADFPCVERDAFVGAPWARGACLIKCGPGSSSSAPRCAHAMSVCEKLAQCATVDVNVEGSVATLKRETSLSNRTSRVRQVAVTHARGERAAGRDGACVTGAPRVSLSLRALAGRTTCILDCPQLNYTRGVAMCFDTPTCVGVDISFQIEGHAAVARLRFARSRSRH